MSTCKIVYNGSEISSSDESSPVSVSYNGSVIASVSDGQTKTLQCMNKMMASNVVVGSRTLNCAGKLMASNIAVTVEQSIDYKTWYLNDRPSGTKITQAIGFISNGVRFSEFKVDRFFTGVYIFYDGSREVYNSAKTPRWISEGYRTVVFDTVPTGTLRTWLEANATPI